MLQITLRMVRKYSGESRMSNWELGSKPYHDGTRDVTINFVNDDSNGAVGGQLWFKGILYTVSGSWAASGSVPGRNASAFAIWGTDGAAATDYVAAAGTMDGPGDAPISVQISLTRVRTSDGQQFGWDGQLFQTGYDWGAV
jgi:hypothetical protein